MVSVDGSIIGKNVELEWGGYRVLLVEGKDVHPISEEYGKTRIASGEIYGYSWILCGRRLGFSYIVGLTGEVRP